MTIPQIISTVLLIDNTKTYAAAIHDHSIDPEILTIYLHPLISYTKEAQKSQQSNENPSWLFHQKRLDMINKHIKNNTYRYILCDALLRPASIDFQNLDNFKNIKKFEFIEFIQQLSYSTISKKVIRSHFTRENKIIAKQKELDRIKELLTANNISDLNIKKIKRLIKK